MRARRSTVARGAHGLIVGVIFSAADLERATRMRKPPDLFELRLDALLPIITEVENAMAALRAPLIITARHPAEGGANDLPVGRRRKLLHQLLPHARFVDVELRSCRALDSILQAAHRQDVRRIISVHDLDRSPQRDRLEDQLAAAARFAPDVFKIVLRTETEAETQRLLAFFDEARRAQPIAAMGIGRCGRRARLALLRRGSVLNYGYISRPQLAGQPSVATLQRSRTRIAAR